MDSDGWAPALARCISSSMCKSGIGRVQGLAAYQLFDVCVCTRPCVCASMCLTGSSQSRIKLC